MKPSALIDKQIADTGGWSGDLLAKLRKLIHEADPEIIEEWKLDTPVFVHKKMVCAIGAFKDHVKVNFFNGAVLQDPDKLFNAGLDAKKTRAIDFAKGDNVNEPALKLLIKEAASLNK